MTAIAFDDDGKEISNYSGILAENVTQIKFNYYAVEEEELGWQGSWTDTAHLPDLVRIEVGEGSQLEWPEFTVRLLMGQ